MREGTQIVKIVKIVMICHDFNFDIYIKIMTNHDNHENLRSISSCVLFFSNPQNSNPLLHNLSNSRSYSATTLSPAL